MIHPTAVIDPSAEIHPSAEIGPYCVIGAGVVIDEGARLVASDLRSTNGTTVIGPRAPRRLRAGESIVVVPGMSLDLGDDTIVEILPPPGVDHPTRDRPNT